MRPLLLCSVLLSLLFASVPAFAAATPVRFENFDTIEQVDGVPKGWKTFSPRPELAPTCRVQAKKGRNRGAALAIQTKSPAQIGGWKTKVDGLVGGRTYRFSAWYRAEKVAHERRSIIARLEWLDQNGKSVRPPEYAIDVEKKGEWTRVEYITAIPTNTQSANIELAMGFAARATVYWDDISLAEESSPPNRVIRAMTVFCRPRGTKSAVESVSKFCDLVEQGAPANTDLICLPEGITVVGNGKTYAEVAEPIPGPTTERLGALARKKHCNIVAGIYERVGQTVYNTAVLIGRNGELIGTYRKTHLPREEWEAGITPGDTYPVFQTDFGKVGLIICWDLQFPEPARAMAVQGAEILLLPIWGGSEVLARARAIENSVFLVSSTYDMRSFIVDPAGKVLAEATKDNPIASADLHLDDIIYQPWLGNMKTRTWKERRPDIPIESRPR